MKPLAIPLLVTLLVAPSLLPGCGGEEALRPPDLDAGHDVCAVCGMAVSDDRYAAAVVLRDNGRVHTLLLDDIGELPRLTLPTHDEAEIFVKDEGTREWVQAEGAHFVKSDTLRTPMGFGIAAFADAGRASARLGEVSGAPVPLSELDPRRGR